MKFILSLFFLFSLSSFHHIYGQTSQASPVYNLLHNNTPVSSIGWEKHLYIDESELDNLLTGPFQQFLIRNRKDLLVYLDGTGRLYRISGSGDHLHFKRIDSTYYIGYNFGAFTFSYKDTIYSFGGYGFWKTNGLLRYFINDKKEWEIVKLNMEVPHQMGNPYDLVWYDQLNGKVYFGFTRQEDNNLKTDSASKNIYNFQVILLDMDKKEISRIGTLSPFLRNQIPGLTNLTSSPFGQLIAQDGGFLFLNYKTNKIYRLQIRKEEKINQSPAITFNPTYYFRDSILLFGNSKILLLDSLAINSSDLIELNEPVYTKIDNYSKFAPLESADGMMPVMPVLFIIILVVGIAFFAFRLGKQNIDFKSAPIKPYNSELAFELLSQKEKQLINLILNNSIQNQPTYIGDINNVLGLTNKNEIIQKKHRSDVIGSINKKFSLLKNNTTNIISKKRSDFDKRSFEYFIEPTCHEIIKKAML